MDAKVASDFHRLDAESFARAFGVDRLPATCAELIAACDFRHRPLHGAERDAVILEVIKRIERDKQVIAAPERRDVWERGWREALNDYVSSGYAEDKLVPRFIRPNQPVRLNSEYAMPASDRFELDFVRVVREWMFRTYFAQVPEIHEFGCGTGFNLLALSQMYPGKPLHGSDFVPASVELVNQIAAARGLTLKGRLFDMTAPDAAYPLAAGAGVFTFGSIEQLGAKPESFVRFLISKKPAICVHIEPTVELYDEDVLIDYLAALFHKKRGYTEGLLPMLKTLENERTVELIKVKRLHFGSLMMEGYSVMAWRPRQPGNA